MPGKRVLILGLDGADWRVLEPLMEAGRLPALAALARRGACAPLASTIPPLTAPAWISFLLGAGPGVHGVLDFLERDARRYEGTTGRVITSIDYPRRTLFDAAGAAGKRVAAVRVPMMFPPWEVNGVVVSGGFTPGGRVFCSPRDLADHLEVGPIDIGKRLLELSEADQVETLEAQLHRAEEQARRVFNLEPFDLAMVHVHTPDNAHHCFWHQLGNGKGHPNRINELYQEVDGFVGRMVALDHWDLVVVASDHGGGPRPARRFQVNSWLAELGLLHVRGGVRPAMSHAASLFKRRFKRTVYRVRRWAPTRLQRGISSLTQAAVAIDWPRTEAYGVHIFQPFYGIELNVAGRQPNGSIPEDAFERRRADILDRLADSARAADLPVAAVMTAGQAFGPGFDPRLPDIVIRLKDDVVGDNALGRDLVVSNGEPGPHEGTGAHSRDGIIMVAGDGVRPGRYGRLAIESVAPTLLSYLGVRPPAGMVGSALAQLFEPGALDPSGSEPLDEMGGGSLPAGITSEEEREIIQSLRGLGYLE